MKFLCIFIAVLVLVAADDDADDTNAEGADITGRTGSKPSKVQDTIKPSGNTRFFGGGLGVVPVRPVVGPVGGIGFSAGIGGGLGGVNAGFSSGLGGLNSGFSSGLGGVNAGFSSGLGGVNTAFNSGLGGVNTAFNSGLGGVNTGFNSGLGGVNTAFNSGLGGVNTAFNSGLGGVNTGFSSGLSIGNPAFGVVNPGLEGGFGSGFGGINQGFSAGIGSVASPSACRYWCRTPQGQVYCCENIIQPQSFAGVVKPGQCPPVRPVCPPVRSFAPPASCSNDGACGGIDKCCFDTCLQQHTCKAPLGFGR